MIKYIDCQQQCSNKQEPRKAVGHRISLCAYHLGFSVVSSVTYVMAWLVSLAWSGPLDSCLHGLQGKGNGAHCQSLFWQCYPTRYDEDCYSIYLVETILSIFSLCIFPVSWCNPHLIYPHTAVLMLCCLKCEYINHGDSNTCIHRWHWSTSPLPPQIGHCCLLIVMIFKELASPQSTTCPFSQKRGSPIFGIKQERVSTNSSPVPSYSTCLTLVWAYLSTDERAKWYQNLLCTEFGRQNAKHVMWSWDPTYHMF